MNNQNNKDAIDLTESRDLISTEEEIDYDAECEKIRKENDILLEDFYNWMKKAGLSDRVAGKHYRNAEFYINTYLLYYELNRPEEGIDDAREFFGNWFIRKTAWSTETTTKSTATSLKKFYAFLAETERIPHYRYVYFKEIIKEEMPEWLDKVRKYNDPSYELSDIFDIFDF
jgi:hypothetical protein